MKCTLSQNFPFRTLKNRLKLLLDSFLTKLGLNIPYDILNNLKMGILDPWNNMTAVTKYKALGSDSIFFTYISKNVRLGHVGDIALFDVLFFCCCYF